MEQPQCKNGHEARMLYDVHLKGALGPTSFKPHRGPGGFQLVKVYKCDLCGDIFEVCEDIQ